MSFQSAATVRTISCISGLIAGRIQYTLSAVVFALSFLNSASVFTPLWSLEPSEIITVLATTFLLLLY